MYFGVFGSILGFRASFSCIVHLSSIALLRAAPKWTSSFGVPLHVNLLNQNNEEMTSRLCPFVGR